MLRMHRFRYRRPSSLAEAVGLLASEPGSRMAIAGGTDLVPNLKHRLFTPTELVSLRGIHDLRGISVDNGWIRIGAGETLSTVASHPEVRRDAPSLAEAAAHVAGPQLRNMGTLGGNVCLDTRCTYYNQTQFWRQALGYCLKKDGDVCHVTKVGKKCVAAHSADTPPVLMTLGAELELVGPAGTRRLPISDFFVADGIQNTRREPAEILTRIHIPIVAGRRAAYAKLRQRNAIDFPLLTVAVAGRFSPDGKVESLDGVVTGLGSRPRTLSGWQEAARGEALTEEICDHLAEVAHRQCHPLENMIADPDWRRAMVPVQVRRALLRLVADR